MADIPNPKLSYTFWRDAPEYLDSTPAIGSVGEVTAYIDGYGALDVWVQGAALRKDGEFSRGGNRCIPVDLNRPLPDWLAAIVADARARLAVEAHRG